MKKLLALALVAAAGTAHAYTIDATVNWAGYTGTLAATGASGTLSLNQLLNDAVLPSVSNKTSFGINFNIAAAPVVAGYTFDHIEWLAYGNTFAGGSALSQCGCVEKVRQAADRVRYIVPKTPVPKTPML